MVVVSSTNLQGGGPHAGSENNMHDQDSHPFWVQGCPARFVWWVQLLVLLTHFGSKFWNSHLSLLTITTETCMILGSDRYTNRANRLDPILGGAPPHVCTCDYTKIVDVCTCSVVMLYTHSSQARGC